MTNWLKTDAIFGGDAGWNMLAHGKGAFGGDAGWNMLAYGEYATNGNIGFVALAQPMSAPYQNPLVSSFSAARPAPPAPHLRINFDTIGQTIFRSIGHCRLPLIPIWAQGIEESGDESVSATQTLAGALCMPLDAAEDGEVFSIWDSDTLVMNAGASIHPLGWSAEDAALLSASLAGITIFPGDEAQLPASVIVADKGAFRTNAFRGLRYVIVPNYPIFGGGGGGGSGGLPNLSFQIRRRNDGEEPREEDEGGLVEFLAGSA